MTTIYSLAIFIIIQLGRFLLRRIKNLEGLSNILHPVSIIWPVAILLPINLQPVGYFIAIFLSALFVFRLLGIIFTIKLSVPSLLNNLLQIILLVIIILVLLNTVLQVKLTGLVVSSAVLTAVIGFALQDILANLFYGIVFSIERPFKIGQWVTVANQTGKIFKINWRTVYIKTLENVTMIVPNTMVSRQEIVNYSYPDTLIRRVIQVGVGYPFPPEKVKKVLLQAAKGARSVLKSPPPEVFVIDFGDHAIQYELRFWIDGYEHYRQTESDVRTRIWYNFHRTGIEIPFPIRTVYLKEALSPQDIQKEHFIKEIDILKVLDESEIANLAKRAHFEEYIAGEAVVHQGDEGDSMFLIIDGVAEVMLADDRGIATKVSELKKGTVFGEMALLTGEKRVTTVQAKTHLKVLVIDRLSFREILMKDPKIVDALSKLLVERQKELMAKKQFLTKEEELGTTKSLLEKIKYFFGL